MINNRFFALLTILIVVFSFGCKNKPRHYTVKEQKTFEENLVTANKYLVTKDQEDISTYVELQGWNMQKTESGLWYEIVKSSENKTATLGQTAHLRYQVTLLNGTLCYSSDSTGIKHFRIGQGGVESGLEEGILLLSEGDAARFIMPPHLAHGLLGDENKIPPRSTIVYNVELLKLTD